MTPALLARLEALRAARRPAVLATRLPDGAQFLLAAAADSDAAPAALLTAADEARRRGRAATVELADGTWFLDVHLPAPRLLIVGAVHVAQSLAPLAAAVGLQPLVIDPRRRFASPERFPGIALDDRWPDEAIRAAGPDGQTAIVFLTHDPKFDDPAIVAALATDAFYLGALGSRRTHAARLERLSAAGCEPAALARLRGPVGLAIGAVTPEEISLSILAEIVAVRRASALGQR